MTRFVAYAIYNIGIRIFNLLFLCYSFFNGKAAKIRLGRHQLNRQLESASSALPTIWFHCSSLGEWEQTIPVVERLKDNLNIQVLISFYSSSGFENAKRQELVDSMIYLPVDYYKAYTPVFSKLNIIGISFTRYDIWPNLVKNAVDRGIPLFLIGAETASLQRYLKPGSFFNHILRHFSLISCNTSGTAELLTDAGFSNVYSDGSPKLERSAQVAASEYKNTVLEAWQRDSLVVIGGSIWPTEIVMLEKLFFDHSIKNLKLILVPHEPSPDVIKSLQETYRGINVLFSQLSEHDSESRVIIMDKVGYLSKIYRFADVAFVGGGFGKGIHNITEPAAAGLPVISGPNNSGFSEATVLKEAGIYYTIRTFEEFEDVMDGLIENETKRIEIRTAAIDFFNTQSGAAERISQHVIEYVGVAER